MEFAVTALQVYLQLSALISTYLLFPAEDCFSPRCVHVHVWSEDSGAVTIGRPVIQIHSILHYSATHSNELHCLQVSPITVFYSGYNVSYIFNCILRNAKQL